MGAACEVYTKKVTFELGEGDTRVPRWVYVELIKSDRICLVDTGTAANFHEIVSFCEEHGVGVDQIDYVIDTHCHPDHIGGNLLFKQANENIVFCAHKSAAPEIEDIDRQFRRRPLPGFHKLIAGPVHIDRVLEEGDRLDAGTEIRVMHTPGHSNGSISLHIPENDLLIIGDSIPGRSDVPIYENVDELRRTIDRLEAVGSAHVMSAFDGDCGPISEVAALGRGVLDRVEAAVQAFLANRESAQPRTDATLVCRYVLDKLGFTGVSALPIIVNSIAAHMRPR